MCSGLSEHSIKEMIEKSSPVGSGARGGQKDGSCPTPQVMPESVDQKDIFKCLHLQIIPAFSDVAV